MPSTCLLPPRVLHAVTYSTETGSDLLPPAEEAAVEAAVPSNTYTRQIRLETTDGRQQQRRTLSSQVYQIPVYRSPESKRHVLASRKSKANKQNSCASKEGVEYM